MKVRKLTEGVENTTADDIQIANCTPDAVPTVTESTKNAFSGKHIQPVTESFEDYDGDIDYDAAFASFEEDKKCKEFTKRINEDVEKNGKISKELRHELISSGCKAKKCEDGKYEVLSH